MHVLHRARMVGTKPYSAPWVSNGKLSSHSGEPLYDVSVYRSVWCLAILQSHKTRDQLCQHLHTLTTAHWTSCKCVLRYLKWIVDHCLYFTRGSLDFHADSDSDWGGDLDDHNSTTRYDVLLGLCLIF